VFYKPLRHTTAIVCSYSKNTAKSATDNMSVLILLYCVHIHNSGALKAVGYDGFSPYCINKYSASQAVVFGTQYGEIILIVLIGTWAVLSITATALAVRRK
jgi:hypothetical protein